MGFQVYAIPIKIIKMRFINRKNIYLWITITSFDFTLKQTNKKVLQHVSQRPSVYNSAAKKKKNFSDIITPKTLVKFTFWAAVDSLVTKYHHLLFCVNIYFYPVEITVINVFFFQCRTTVLQTCFHFLAALMDAFDDKSTKKKKYLIPFPQQTVRAKCFSFTFARLHGQNYQE